MANVFPPVFLTAVGVLFMAVSLPAQAPGKSSAPVSSISVERAIDLAASGHCQEALPVLKKSISHVPGKELKYRAAMATARCAMSLNQAESAVNALWILRRDFPNDPEVLYITTHYFSELATRASREL